MKPFNILIVEDELIIAEGIKQLLLRQGYKVVGIAPSAVEAISIIMEGDVDLALVDITLVGEKNGIWLGEYIRKQCHLPFVFLTSHADEKTLKEALLSNPDGYVLKPFTEAELTTTIEIAYQKFNAKNSDRQEHVDPSFLLKDGVNFVKVSLADTLFIKSDKNYIEVHHKGGVVKVRGSIKELLNEYNFSTLVQIHRSYIINIKAVNGYDAFDVLIADFRIPLGGIYKEVFIHEFKKHHGMSHS